MSEWHRLGMIGLRLACQHGQTDAVALAAHMFDRIDRMNPRINVFVELDRDRAMDSAHGSAARLAADEGRPLEAAPIAMAADIAIKGLDASAGLSARRGMPCEADADVVARLTDAGAMILGTLNMDEARAGLSTNNPWAGRSFNPHCDGASPGGGSGGAAAAVAAGLCMAAIGGDTLGAIRTPAALCGIFAFRPTPGMLPTGGLVPVSLSLDTLAIATRSLDDLSTVLNALAPPDLSTALRKCRFAALDDGMVTGMAPEVSAHYDYALSLLPEPPARFPLPSGLARIRQAARLFVMRELAATLPELGEERCAMLSETMSARMYEALSRKPALDEEDQQLLRLTGRALREAAGEDTIIVTPACPDVAPMHGTVINQGQQDFTLLADVGGLPSIIIPAGRTPGKLPVGLQLMGPQGSEAMLIAQARMLNERLRGYAPPTSWW